ncbi:MAG: hypothetical protein P1P81_07720 [Desulfobulbales bacterium]|nr:hypothetical protein [Desulfobulbales bacterium]
MRKIMGIAAILLIWVGSANGGELKVQVPVDEFEQIKSRLETLEQENQALRSEVKTMAKRTTDAELKEQRDKLARENEELRQQAESLAEKSLAEAAHAEKKDSRIDAMGSENRQLKRTVAVLKESGEALRSDRRTARQVYFEANKTFATHIYR